MKKKKPASPKSSSALSESGSNGVQKILQQIETDNVDLEKIAGDIEKLPKKDVKKAAVLMAQRVTTSVHRGPLPPAAELQAYEETLPGAADRIFSMAELEQSHRHGRDEKADGSLTSERRLGFYVGAGLFLILVAATVVGFQAGMGNGAFSFLAVGVLGLLSKFIPSHQEKE